MEIKLLQDCKKGDKGQIIEMRPFFARSLIKRGLAVEVEPVFRVGDLCFAEIAMVEASEDFKIIKGEVSDIGFWLQTFKCGVFVHYPPRFHKYLFVGGDYYQHISTGKKYLGDNCLNNMAIKNGDLVVNHESVYNILDMEDELNARGWTQDTELTLSQIRQFEQDLNNKYNAYVGMTKYVR